MSFKVEWNGSAIEKAINEAAADALEEIGKDLLEKSQKLCPKDRGFNGGLVSTAEVELNRETLSVRVEYEADHAAMQHENGKYKHKPGEQKKFLQQPLDENAGSYLNKVADAIKSRVGR
jgi:hypothetical protein